MRNETNRGKRERNRVNYRENQRSGYPGNGYYRRKRKEKREQKKRLLVAAAAAFFLLLLTVLGVKKLLPGKPGSLQNPAGTESSAAEIELKTAVTINDVDITGMSRREAEEAVLKQHPWGMTARLEQALAEDEPYAVANLLQVKLKKILDKIYAPGAVDRDHYALDAEGLETEIAAEAAAMAKQWNRAAKNGAIASYDKEHQRFVYTESQVGRAVDEAAAEEAIRTAMREKNYGASLSIKADRIEPEISAEEAKKRYKVIGTFTTETTQNPDRNNNIKLACEAIDGKILQPGEEFSFNHTTGNRTLERGYKPAGAYQNGKVVLEPGGGVCQISSTLYNAVIRAGLMPTERHSHTFEPSYVTPGEDATVSYDGYDGPDMRFVNTTASSLALRATFYNRIVTISLVGLPVLEDGTTVSLHSVKTGEYDNGGIEYIEDTTMQPGEEKQISGGTMGSKWVTNLVTKKDGKVVSDSFFHNSIYKGHSKKIARNTSGTVTANPDPYSLLITENTETLPEQASSAATEAGAVSPAGPGVTKPESQERESTKVTTAESPAPGPGQGPSGTIEKRTQEVPSAVQGPGEIVQPFPGN